MFGAGGVGGAVWGGGAGVEGGVEFFGEEFEYCYRFCISLKFIRWLSLVLA